MNEIAKPSTAVKRTEPAFLLELPHAMRQLVMKRGYLLRSQRTRTLMCVGKGGQKSWLEAALISKAGDGQNAEENWDSAHALAGKCKRELHCDVYIEPATSNGRFKYLTTPEETSDWMNPAELMGHGEDGNLFNMGVSMGGAGFGGSDLFGAISAGLGGFGGMSEFGGPEQSRRSGGDMFGSFGLPNMPNIPGMPHIPDPMKDLLPPQVREAMGQKEEKAKAKKLAPEFPALRKLPGFSNLPESQRMMFEAEARELEPVAVDAGGLMPELPMPNLAMPSMTGQLLEDPEADDRSLAALSVNPKISAVLKRFLLEQFEPAAE
jgi:hypothetical protein